MAEITAKLVKELRDKTNAGMMDCQRALKENNGDLDAAVDYLRKKGIVGAEKRAGREAKEGVIYAVVSPDAKVGVLAEVNCETDFVAKNDGFRAFVDSVAQHIAKFESANDGSVDAISETPSPDGQGTLGEYIKAKVGEVGENIVLRRFRRFSAASNGLVTSYIHMAGRVGVLLDVTTGKAETHSTDGFKNLVKDITLQIAASSPDYLSRADVPEAAITKENEIQRERMQSQLEKKPENIQQKIVEGAMGKFYSQICLLEQAFIKEPDQTVEQLIKSTEKSLGDTIQVVRFARFAVGEELKA
jgi:elongation factor Ts